MKHTRWFLMCGVLLVIVAATQHSLWLRAQNAPPATSAYPSEEYLLLGDATRGAGEPMLAVDPTNPKNIIAVAMGNLHRLGGKTFTGNDEYHVTEGSTITWLGVTHDGGLTWKVGELPILTGKYTRCPDSFAGVTADGTFLAGCEPRETSGEIYGTSAVVVSLDKGDTWGKPADIVSSYGLARFAPGLKPRIGGNSPWDRPFLFFDDSTGVVYGQAGGGETDIDQEPGHFRTQSYLTASTDKGKSFGTIYAWESKDYPQSGRGHMAAANGVVVVLYAARSAPAAENATCPCMVLGLSNDRGKTFTYHVVKNLPVVQAGRGRGGQPGGGQAVGVAPGSRGGGGGPGPGGGGVAGLAADPTKPGRFAILTYADGQYQATVSDDFGQTWSPFVPAGSTANATSLTKPWFEFSRKGMLGLMWRAIYPDRTYDIWSSLSRDGGKSFSPSLRVSHALSPSPIPGRNAGLFGDDIQNLAMDDANMHLVWGDSRAGFQAVWYGRVPFSAYAAANR
jgi:hypothetical protein